MSGIKDGNSLQIVWNGADNSDCGVVMYYVELKVTAHGQKIKEDTTLNRIYTFTGLSPDTHYTASVYGSNQAGEGETASIRLMTTSSDGNGNGTYVC